VAELTGLPIPLLDLRGLLLKGGESMEEGRGGKSKGKGRRKGKVEGRGHTGTSFSPLRALGL